MENKLNVYNTLTKKKELFVPICNGKISLYACGITPSSDAHIGHAFQAVIFDTITKYLRYMGYDLTYVRNYTDVDDKIIAKANELGVDARKYAEDNIKKIDNELHQLGCSNADVEPKVSNHIPEIIDFIEKLIAKGYAYVTDSGDVFYKVAMFSDYGKLSNNVVSNNINGYRKENVETKDDNADFALWKSAKDNEISWDSPWGKGRPGWHIECSVMSTKYLGEHLDIHGGGRDLQFPHHENEIAQSEALYGAPFAKYWLHNGLIKINGQKMSKSLGNSITLEELLSKFPKDVIRLTFLKNSYKTDINITDEVFRESESQVYRIYLLIKKINFLNIEAKLNKTAITDDFIKEMNDDFNTPNVIANFFKYETELNNYLKSHKNEETVNMLSEVLSIMKIFGLFQEIPDTVINRLNQKYLLINNITETEINALLEQRKIYRETKDYLSSDKIRNELLEKNIKVSDVNGNQEWIVNI